MKYFGLLLTALLSSSLCFADTQAICTNKATGAQLILKKSDDVNGTFLLNQALMDSLKQQGCQKVIQSGGGTFDTTTGDQYMYAAGAQELFTLYTMSSRGGVQLVYMDNTSPQPASGRPNFQFAAGECTGFEPVPVVQQGSRE